MTKRISLSLLAILTLLYTLQAQQLPFEAMNIPHLTDHKSESRSANFLDLNNDGWDDIFITNSAGRGGAALSYLYLNDQKGSFERVSEGALVETAGRSVSASFGDGDNDGDLDAFVVAWGSDNINHFFKCEGPSDYKYEADNVSGLKKHFSESVLWLDANSDGLLDLYFTNSYGIVSNSLYLNDGQGGYTQDTSIFTAVKAPSRSANWLDIDDDGDLDLFVANENYASNTLYKNDGQGQYTIVDDLSIVKSRRNSAGSSWGDVDNDGDLDLFVANYGKYGQANQLFLQEDGQFMEVEASAIVEEVGSSFGSSFGDLDNDGDLDLIVCNAYLDRIKHNSIFINDGHGQFTRDTTSALALWEGQSYGVGLGDLNQDGWLDVLMTSNTADQANTFHLNKGQGQNWIKIRCKGTASNQSAIGAKVMVLANIDGENISQRRDVESSAGTCGQNSYDLHFGLGNAETIDRIEITWPSGLKTKHNKLSINQTHIIIEEKQ